MLHWGVARVALVRVLVRVALVEVWAVV